MPTRSSVANADCALALTNARCGRCIGRCDDMRIAASRSYAASRRAVRALEGVRCRIADRRHGDEPRQQRVRHFGAGVPRVQRIDRRGNRVEVSSEPARTLRRQRVRRRPDVGAFEMRAAGVLVARALDQREPAFVEDRPQTRETRMKAELVARQSRGRSAAPVPPARRAWDAGSDRTNRDTARAC